MFYLHDEFSRLRFALVEPLTREELADLEASWRTAESTRGNRALVVDARRLGSVDEAARRLLDRFREGGATILEAADPEPGSGRAFRLRHSRAIVKGIRSGR